MQKAVVIYYESENKNNLKELNALLTEGWKMISQMPMSGTEGYSSRSLVVLEKNS